MALPLRRAKIVCTLGPVSSSPEMVDKLVCAGMDVARLNFSHGTHEEHAQPHRRRPARLRTISETHRHSRRLAGAENPHGCAGAEAPGAAAFRAEADHHDKTHSRHGRSDQHDVSRAAVLGAQRRPDFAERRPDRAARAHDARPRGCVPGREWRRIGRAPGNQSAGHTADDSSAHAKGSAGPCIRA